MYGVQKRRAASGPVHGDKVLSLSNDTRCQRIRATEGVNGEEQDMVSLINHEDWEASTIMHLYRAWLEIEVPFKQLKQTLKLYDLVSY